MYSYSVYIMKQLAQATLLIAVSLTSIVWLTQALRFIDFIVNRGISFTSFLELTLLLIPSLMLFILPFALLFAVLFVYYRLMMDSELLVLSGAGLSRFQIAKPAINIAIMVSLIAYSISLYILPVSYHAFKEMQEFMRDNYASLLLQEDVFNNPVEGLTVYIRDRDKEGILYGIIVHDSRDPKEPAVTMMAEKGQLIQSAQGPTFILYNGNRQKIENGKLSFLDFAKYTLDISFYTNSAGKRTKQPEEMFLDELLYPDTADELEKARLIAEGHNRISYPLFPLALTLFALAVLLSGEFNRRGQWQRITFIVVCSGVVLSVAIGILHLAVKNEWLISLLYINIVMIILFSIWKLLFDMEVRKNNSLLVWRYN